MICTVLAKELIDQTICKPAAQKHYEAYIKGYKEYVKHKEVSNTNSFAIFWAQRNPDQKIDDELLKRCRGRFHLIDSMLQYGFTRNTPILLLLDPNNATKTIQTQEGSVEYTNIKDGHHRIMAAKYLGIEYITVTFKPYKKIVTGATIYVKQYGLPRSGTNYTAWMVKNNFQDVRVLSNTFGLKHAYHIFDENTFQKKWITSSNQKYPVDEEMKKAYLMGEIRYICIVKHPYTYYISNIRRRHGFRSNQKLKYKHEYLVRYINKWNELNRNWYSLTQVNPRAIIVRLEEWIDKPEFLTKAIQNKLELPECNQPVLIPKTYVKEDEMRSKSDKNKYSPENYRDYEPDKVLTDYAKYTIQKLVDKDLMNKLGYSFDCSFLGNQITDLHTKDQLNIINRFSIAQPIQRGRKENFAKSLKRVSIDGQYAEFGVNKGHSINIIAQHIKDNDIWGFDSFSPGLPEDWRFSETETRPAYKKADKKYIPEVRDNVKLVVGLFEDTLPEWKRSNPMPFSFIHIDCDIYESTKHILDQLNDQIVPGTILVFDEFCDWRLTDLYSSGFFSSRVLYECWEEGEYKATMEWIKERDRHIEPVSYGKYFATFQVIR